MTPAAPLLLTVDQPPEQLLSRLQAAWAEGRWVGLCDPADRARLASALGSAPDRRDQGPPPSGPPPSGPQAAVVLGSGGSTAARRWCVQPLAHLEASAAATAAWLRGEGIDPASCLHLDPLPLQHVSGLLPVLRCRCWGAELRLLPPAWLRAPTQLAAACPLPTERPVLLSLVPTQLQRLLASPEAVAWLRRCTVIWLGGAALSAPTAARARREGLRLAPCYGATETAAMVCALSPARFLAGEAGCGPPLADVALRLDPGSGAVEIRTPRLALGWLEGGRLLPLPRRSGGWWRSGDAGLLQPGGLQLLGRLDGAVSSGAETVHPAELEQRLIGAAAAAGLPLEAVLLLGCPDPEWGERLEALVRPTPGAEAAELIASLQSVVAGWRPAERPRRWHGCDALAPSQAGKWERPRWRRWLEERLSAAG